MINPFERFYDTEIEVYEESVKIHMKKRVKKHFWGVLCVIFSHMKMNSKTVYTV